MPNFANRPSAGRRRLLGGLALLAVLPWLDGSKPAATGRSRWQAWRAFAAASLSDDGRTIDYSQADQRTTSEGQAYSLFFSLVDNDPASFDRILEWTSNNLAAGDLGQRLPAWLWGQAADSGRWTVLDANSASDADLWIAYSLLEAARRWRRPRLRALARDMLLLVQRQAVADLPALGPMLLPAPVGFVTARGWRLNPSYLPLPLLRRFAHEDPAGPWETIATNTLRVLRSTRNHGFAPDWIIWNGKRLVPDLASHASGSYNAIRCYLWAGMTNPYDPFFARQLRYLHGPLARLRAGQPMWETVDTRSGRGRGRAGPGFRAALLPYLSAQGESALAARIYRHLPRMPLLADDRPAYYDQVLSLFGRGWLESRFRFDSSGYLQRH